MRSAISLLLPALLAAAGPAHFRVLSDAPGAWPEILGAMGLLEGPAASARVLVVRAGAPASREWLTRVDSGAVLVLEGESSLAEMFGFRPTADSVRVASLIDMHDPKLPVIWEQAIEMRRFSVPANARVFARERWEGAPLVAGYRRGSGAVLWVAQPPGKRGYERFPFIPQALVSLGVDPPFQSRRLWAFFDSSYRLRVDLDYFAERWRRAGIAGLHVAAWHFFERNPASDEYLSSLISACHRRGIQVYAWLELPHVSERFWQDHPEWREKTAIGQDAHLDWRKLMNLQNRDCFRAVAAGVRDLALRFDWDGINLAELYFESLEGMANPSRFTPMNADVRREFRALHDFDALEVFSTRQDTASRRLWLDFRAGVAKRMQEEWLAEVQSIRRDRPHLDVVLTHVDDRFDATMRDAIGADAAAVLPLLAQQPFTFLVEDPATTWHLGPQRYREIARRYEPLTPSRERLAIDINIVDRYQNVYPTKQQTGTELLQLVHTAAGAFPRVALYFEKSLRSADIELLPSAASAVRRVERIGAKLVIDSAFGAGIPWAGPALVDGRPWPITNGEVVWLPVGAHTVEAGAAAGRAAHVLDLNAELQAASYTPDGSIELAYRSEARAYAVLDRAPIAINVDGVDQQPERCGSTTIVLPRGQHLVTIRVH